MHVMFHRQVQSFREYFQSDCKDPIAWLNAPNYFIAITEGWAAYAEDQLYPEDTTLYSSKTNKTILRQKYGMLYYQVSLFAMEGERQTYV